MEIIKIKKLHPKCRIPEQSSPEAGGWDVVVTEIAYHGGYVKCKLGFALQPPVGYRIVIVPRSSITKTNWIMQNSPGLGDSDYTGEYEMRFRPLKSTESFPYSVGDRIGQIYLEKIIPIQFEEVDELTETLRGPGGFGSTGK